MLSDKHGFTILHWEGIPPSLCADLTHGCVSVTAPLAKMMMLDPSRRTYYSIYSEVIKNANCPTYLANASLRPAVA